MKRKKGLGKLLLRSFQKPRTSAKVRRTSSKKTKTLKLSAWVDDVRSPKIPVELPTEREVALPVVVSPPPPPPPAVLEPISLETAFAPPRLLTEDIIRPNDRLKQSIEAFLLDQRSPHTRRAYGKDLKRFVQYLHLKKFEKGAESLNRTVLIGYKEFLLSEKLEHTTVDRHIATLRSFFQWLVDDGILEKSPAEGVRFLNPKRISRTQGFSDEEVKKILALPNLHTRVGSMHYAMLMILFYCALRRSEACELRTSNLGSERGQKVLKLRGKGNAERIIVLIPPVWSAIQHYFYITRRDLMEDDYLFKPLRNNRNGNLKKPIDPSMVFYIVTRYAKLAGITHRVSPHSCRATAISNARDHQVPDRAIQEFAGWASTDMITRYDKRKTAVEDSAAHSIVYGSENRPIPQPLDQAEDDQNLIELNKPSHAAPNLDSGLIGID